MKRTTVLAAVTIVAASLAGCSASASSAPTATQTADSSAWLDDSVPRSELDDQGRLNRIGMATSTIRALGVSEAVLSNDAVDDAVTLTCDSLDRGDDLGATLDALAARASTASGHGAKVVYAAVTELCPEYMPMLDALGDR